MSEQEEKKLNFFERFLNILRGRVDVQTRTEVITDPKKPQTSSYLTESQAEFVTESFWLNKTFPGEFEPVKEYADNLLLSVLSIKGRATENSIRLVGAIEETESFKNMFGSVGDQPKKRQLIKRKDDKHD